MFRNERWRWARMIAPPIFAICAVLMLACGDGSGPTERSPDEWAEGAVMRMRVSGDLTMGSTGRVQTVAIPPFVADVRRYHSPTGQDVAFATTDKTTQIRHIRARNGRIYTFAQVRIGNGHPPKRTYLFENGRIRAITTSSYVRRGASWVQKETKMAVFDERGQPVAQFAGEASPQSAIHSTASVSKDAVARLAAAFLPATLGAQELFACSSEWLAVAAGSLVVADLLALLTAETTACLNGIVVSCGPIPATAAKLLASMAALSLLWDKLRACREAKAQALGGGETMTTSEPGITRIEYEELTATAQTFIDRSIEAGNYACIDEGNWCVYY